MTGQTERRFNLSRSLTTDSMTDTNWSNRFPLSCTSEGSREVEGWGRWDTTGRNKLREVEVEKCRNRAKE
jgi:hypothetical protein